MLTFNFMSSGGERKDNMGKETKSETEGQGQATIPRLSIPGNACVHCGTIIERTTIVCPGCGWVDPITRPVGQAMNDVKSEEFESKMDDFFTSKTKEKESGRKCSIKIFGQWT